MTGFIQRELRRLQAALPALRADDERYVQARAAQQALAWALEPGVYERPIDCIIAGQLQPSKDRDDAAPIKEADARP